MNTSEFKNVVKKIKSLPTLPQVFYKIVETIELPDSSAEDVKKTIRNDPSISAKVLKIANSALYGYTKEINNISQAIVILGFDMVKSIALSVSVFSSFPKINTATKFDREKFWIHSIAAAEAAMLFANKIDSIKKDHAFLIGLIHDIGKIVLDYYFSPEYRRVIAKVNEDNCFIKDAEAVVLNFNHSLIGEWLGEQWNFPESILAGIAYHHKVNLAPDKNRMYALIGNLSDIIARTAEVGNGGDSKIPEIDYGLIENTQLTPELIEEIIQQIKDKKEYLDTFVKVTS